MRVSLHLADLHYGGGLVLHTASSGSIPSLAEVYLRLDDGETVGVGEVRANIAYLNGYDERTVVDAIIAAVRDVDWRRDPIDLIAMMTLWEAPYIAPVRTLIDCALHDLVARRERKTVAAWLGAPNGDVSSRTNQTLFWSSHEDFLVKAQAYVDRGYRDLKVRIAVGDFAEDLRRIAALRQRLGGRVKIAADANGRWTADEALARLEALAAYDLAYVEQPVPPGDWASIDELARKSPVPVMLDESIATADDIARVCAYRGRVFAHLKLVKLGGIAPTIAAARNLSEAGVPFMIGQMNEGAAATAAALHVACATAPEFAELYGADGLVNDPVSGISYTDGAVRAERAPGLGVKFDAATTKLIGDYRYD
ncbi:enolase superfamily enzyme related to L-alanine-DL-glutamate epimerase [Bradyrhizobium sp. YR681]|uniref:mandelate racemase/muconate lactonizing enzyme family protein n=1 Tax=Bradyrhizobium sp. YR681 TaxID=1144344 RepID=UPI00027104AE|nr:mandelate racemase/muconate lactonizing enzyme family protein [Bradyrhizobium sp. YR681]EJN16155.1 enolase superfamily enzyme related to L-alanine-DL-glutamate epimerase [Bradyrhizobium sp. YR681]